MDAMLYPNDCYSRLFIGVFALQTESYGSDTQITVVFLHTFRDAIVESHIGEVDTLRLLILKIHFDDYVSTRERNAVKIIRMKVMRIFTCILLEPSRLFANNSMPEWATRMHTDSNPMLS